MTSMTCEKGTRYIDFPCYVALLKIQQKKRVIIFLGEDAEEVFVFMKPKVFQSVEHIRLENLSDSTLSKLEKEIISSPNSLTIVETQNSPEYRECDFFDTIVKNSPENIFICCGSELFNYSDAKDFLDKKQVIPNLFVYEEQKGEASKIATTTYMVNF